MWWAMAAQAGISLVQSAATNETAEEQRLLTTYQNRMRMLSNAANQNTITDNERFAVEESVIESINIQKSALRARGAAEVAAAAAGVTGGSVGQALLDITRDSATAEHNRRFNLYKTFLDVAAQRESSRQGVFNALDLRTNAGESSGQTAFNAGSAAFGTFMQYQ